MRFAILSVLAIAGTVLADGDPVNQIPDGQIQAHPSSSSTEAAAPPPPAYGTTIPSPPLETTPAVTETTPSVETSPVIATTPTPEVTTTTPLIPVTPTTSPLASYPVPNNTSVPLTTGSPNTTASTLPGYQSPSSATEGSPVGSESPQPANPNAAGIVGVQMGLTAAAVAGLLVFLA